MHETDSLPEMNTDMTLITHLHISNLHVEALIRPVRPVSEKSGSVISAFVLHLQGSTITPEQLSLRATRICKSVAIYTACIIKSSHLLVPVMQYVTIIKRQKGTII